MMKHMIFGIKKLAFRKNEFIVLVKQIIFGKWAILAPAAHATEIYIDRGASIWMQ